MPVRKYRRRSSEISYCLKYLIFSVNVLFWLAGLCILAVGVWAWNEKDSFRHPSNDSSIILDPAFLLICCGTVAFVIGFTGCVGALRENTALLSAYSLILIFLLLLECALGFILLVVRDKGYIKEQATDGLRLFITHYRDDPDQQNLIDWIQEDWLQCCGIEGPNDWDNNNYFNCSSVAVRSREACGVPFSCCKRQPNQVIRNKQCGYDVRRETNNDLSRTINEKGCVQAGEEWVERNLITISSTVIFLAFLQILAICFAQNLRADIFAQKSKWRK